MSFEKSISIGLRSGEYLGRKKGLAPTAPKGAPDRDASVRAKIVHDNDVAVLQGQDQDLVDVETDALAIDRTFEQPWRFDTKTRRAGSMQFW